MFRLIVNLLRKNKIKKNASNIRTGLLPLKEISSVNIIINVEEPGFDMLKEDILAWGRQTGLKTNIYFIDFRRLGKDELLLTSIQTTILKRELNWIGIPDPSKTASLFCEESDLLISMIDNYTFPTDYICRCTKARFKIGRCGYEGNPFDMVVSGAANEELRSDSRQIFMTMTEMIKRIR